MKQSPAGAWVVLVMGLLVAPATAAKVGVAEFVVCAEAGNDREPALSPSWIVWTHEPPGRQPDIWAYGLEGPGIRPLCQADGVQESPDVDGDLVVWSDRRDADGLARIYSQRAYADEARCLYSISEISLLCPRIAGSKLAFQLQHEGSWDVDGRDLAANKFLDIAYTAEDEDQPDISGDVVVYRSSAHNGDIMGYRISTGETLDISTDNWPASAPAIDGDWVAYQHNWNGHDDIMLHNLKTGEGFPACLQGGNQQSPAISGGRVVWVDWRHGNADIYGFDLDTKREFPVCTEEHDQLAPAICGDVVVWEDHRNVGRQAPNGTDIYGGRFVNAPPRQPVVALAPAQPTDAQNVTVTVTWCDDPDGDPIEYLYGWSVLEGNKWAQKRGRKSATPTDTLPAGLTAPGQAWKCTVVATDGPDRSPPAECAFTIAK